VDNGSFASSGNRVAMDPTGAMNFGYYHHPSNQIRFSSNIAGPCIRQVVDEEGNESFGRDLELAMDNDGYGHIVTPGIQYTLMPPLEYFNVDPDSLDFGPVEPGSSKTLILKLSNPSGKDIIIDSVKINDPRFSFNKTSFILKRWENDSISITFTQSETSGVDEWLRIVYNYPSGMMMDIPVIVKGWEPELSTDPETVSFGPVPIPNQETRTVLLENSGATDLIFSDIYVKFEFMPGFEVPLDFYLDRQNCTTLQPGQSCEVVVGFQPFKDGTQSSYLNIISNDPKTPVRKISITGSTPVPQIYPAENIIEFGYCPTGQSVTDTVILINGGSAVLDITSMSIQAGVDSDQFGISGSCSSIPPRDSCFLPVTLTPTKQGDLNAKLIITSNSQYTKVLNITLKGSSFLRTLELSTNIINFGNVHVGEKSPVLLELRNTGATELSIGTIRSVTGIQDQSIPHLRVYPVPAVDHIVVEIPEKLFIGSSVRMKILDLSGKNLFINKNYNLSGSPVTINIDFLNDGIYLLEVSDNYKSHWVKIVKIR